MSLYAWEIIRTSGTCNKILQRVAPKRDAPNLLTACVCSWYSLLAFFALLDFGHTLNLTFCIEPCALLYKRLQSRQFDHHVKWTTVSNGVFHDVNEAK